MATDPSPEPPMENPYGLGSLMALLPPPPPPPEPPPAAPAPPPLPLPQPPPPPPPPPPAPAPPAAGRAAAAIPAGPAVGCRHRGTDVGAATATADGFAGAAAA